MRERDPQLDKLWRDVPTSDPYPPIWRNAPDQPTLKSYGTPDHVIRVDGDVMTVVVSPAPLRFVAAFCAVFLPLCVGLLWHFMPNDRMRPAMVAAAVVISILTFALIYFFMRYHARQGDYMVIDRGEQTITLPRVGKTFPLDRVTFQWIEGGSTTQNDINADLNLLVTDGDDVLRYHVIGSPYRKRIEQVVLFSGIPLDKVIVGWRGNRDADVDTAQA